MSIGLQASAQDRGRWLHGRASDLLLGAGVAYLISVPLLVWLTGDRKEAAVAAVGLDLLFAELLGHARVSGVRGKVIQPKMAPAAAVDLTGTDKDLSGKDFRG